MRYPYHMLYRRNIFMHRSILIAGFMTLGVCVHSPSFAQERIRDCIVKIYTTYNKPRYSRPWMMRGQSSRTGSGCIIAGNRVLTNAHVVSDQTFLQVRRAGQADKYVAAVESVSHELDLAILTVEDQSFFQGTNPLKIGDLPQIGQKVIAYGFPKGGTRITITEGIASRIDRKRYSHSNFWNLVCQIDAAVNSGSSGGPVISNNKIVGVAFQVTKGQNIGYMVPAPVIKHFFDDLKDGTHNGVPDLPITWQNLENPQIRHFHGMTKNQSGILITKIAPLFMGEGLFDLNDIILSIDGYDVANDGSIGFRDGERINLDYAVDQKQVNDVISIRVLRQGQVQQLEVDLKTSKTSYGHLVPRNQYETSPSYFITGGLVFSQLTTNYLLIWNKWSDVPHELKSYYYATRSLKNQDREQIVVLIDVLADKINVGYTYFEDKVVSQINGKSIQSMQDLVHAFEDHKEEHHQILIEPKNSQILLSVQEVRKRNPIILAKYKVPQDRSSDLANPITDQKPLSDYSQ